MRIAERLNFARHLLAKGQWRITRGRWTAEFYWPKIEVLDVGFFFEASNALRIVSEPWRGKVYRAAGFMVLGFGTAICYYIPKEAAPPNAPDNGGTKGP